METLADQFQPSSLRWLFVGESSPSGETHFYRANSNLFSATRAAFANAFGAKRVPGGMSFLDWFRDRGCWLVDLADRPINRLEPRARAEAAAQGVGPLAHLLRQSQPEKIVLVKATIASAVREAIATADWHGELVELPFPVRQWRDVYIKRLSAVLRNGGN